MGVLRQALSRVKWSAVEFLDRRKKLARARHLRETAADWSRDADRRRCARICVYVGAPLDWNFLSSVAVALAGDPRFSVLIVGCTDEVLACVPGPVGACSAVRVREFGGLQDVPAEVVVSCGGGSCFFRGAKRMYVMHSLVSTHVIYPEGAFDAYDFILCAGPHHMRELAAAFRVRGVHRPVLIPFGYPWVDELMAREAGRREALAGGGPPEILFAPSWGPQNALAMHGEKIVESLIGDYRVCVRPHIQSLSQDAPVLARLEERFGRHPRFRMDRDGDSSTSLMGADLMISDWSGVAFEYALARLRPVLFVDGPMKVRNPDWRRVMSEPGIECTYRHRVGCVVSDVGSLRDEVAAMLASTEAWRARLLEIRGELLFHPGESVARVRDVFGAVTKNEIPEGWADTRVAT